MEVNGQLQLREETIFPSRGNKRGCVKSQLYGLNATNVGG